MSVAYLVSNRAPRQRAGDRMAFVDVSLELLAALLKFPEGTVIQGVRQSPDKHMTMELRVTSPSLDLVREGTAVPTVVPSYSATEARGIHIDASFVSWGQDSEAG